MHVKKLRKSQNTKDSQPPATERKLVPHENGVVTSPLQHAVIAMQIT